MAEDKREGAHRNGRRVDETNKDIQTKKEENEVPNLPLVVEAIRYVYLDDAARRSFLILTTNVVTSCRYMRHEIKCIQEGKRDKELEAMNKEPLPSRFAELRRWIRLDATTVEDALGDDNDDKSSTTEVKSSTEQVDKNTDSVADDVKNQNVRTSKRQRVSTEKARASEEQRTNTSARKSRSGARPKRNSRPAPPTGGVRKSKRARRTKRFDDE